MLKRTKLSHQNTMHFKKITKDHKKHAEIKLKIHLFHAEAKNTLTKLSAMNSEQLQLTSCTKKTKQKELCAMQDEKRKLQATLKYDNITFRYNDGF